jgi:hypothetical protein
MTTYLFTTRFETDAPAPRLFAALQRPQDWAAAWPEARSMEVVGSDDEATRMRLAIRATPPYTMLIDAGIVRIDPPDVIEWASEGAVEGLGKWEIDALEDVTFASYRWEARVTPAWLKATRPITQRVLDRYYRSVARHGIEALLDHIGGSLLSIRSSVQLPRTAGRLSRGLGDAVFTGLRRRR